MLFAKKNLVACVVLLLSGCADSEKKLPILGNRQAVEKVVNGKTVIDTMYQTIPDFRFVNQDSVFITNKEFDGKIYVADFFFTSCTSICPVMHRNMLKLYNTFKDNPDVKFLSHSIDYKYDTPNKLKHYAQKLGVSDKWQFVIGSHDSIYNVAAKNYLVSVGEDVHNPEIYVHQGYFILVDKQRRLRGAYEGTNEQEVEKLSKDMQVLLNEYKQ